MEGISFLENMVLGNCERYQVDFEGVVYDTMEKVVLVNEEVGVAYEVPRTVGSFDSGGDIYNGKGDKIGRIGGLENGDYRVYSAEGEFLGRGNYRGDFVSESGGKTKCFVLGDMAKAVSSMRE